MNEEVFQKLLVVLDTQEKIINNLTEQVKLLQSMVDSCDKRINILGKIVFPKK